MENTKHKTVSISEGIFETTLLCPMLVPCNDKRSKLWVFFSHVNRVVDFRRNEVSWGSTGFGIFLVLLTIAGLLLLIIS